jgi:hypothetical protein
MDLVTRARLLTLSISLAMASGASAQGLSLTIGNSVAGQNYAMKSAQFVFRVTGCSDLSKAQVTATAEGIVGGVRRSTPLRPVPSPAQAGVYAIPDQGGADGNWVVAITANCQNETAGVIIPINGRSFVREGTLLLSHAPSQTKIETALKTTVPPPPPPPAR